MIVINNDVDFIYFGRLPISAIYQGGTLIWEPASAVESVIDAGYWRNDKPWMNEKPWKNN